MTSQSTILYAPGAATQSSDLVGSALDQWAYASLCAFAFLTTSAEALPQLGGLVLTRWLGLAAFGLVLLRTGVVGRGRRLSELHYWMLAFATWASASILWTADLDGSLERAGTYFQLLLLAWVVWVVASSEARVLGLLQSYVLGTCICAVGVIANALMGRGLGQMDDTAGPDMNRYTMSGLNPNDLGLMLAWSIPMTIYLLARGKGKLAGAVVGWLQLVLAVTAIFLSGSRGSLLAAAVALLMLPLALVRLPAWQTAFAAPAFAGAIASAVFVVPHDTWKRFLGLAAELTEGTMTHRTQIWAASAEVFRQHPLLGVGSGAHPVAVANLLGRPLVAHNTFISVLAELGVTGELLLLGLLCAMLYSTLRMARLERALWVLTMAAWCVGACSGTWEYRKTTWFLLSLLAAHAYAQRKPARPALPAANRVSVGRG